MVEKLLETASIDSEHLSLNLENINLTELIEQQLTKYRLSNEQMEFSFSADQKEIFSSLDRFHLESAIGNLIDNAIKYSPEGSKIEVSARQVEDGISIEVKDSGPGIAEEHHERLFERFYSVDKARSKELGGSGIGLAIVKHIARAHGGREGVISRPGEGSTFSIVL